MRKSHLALALALLGGIIVIFSVRGGRRSAPAPQKADRPPAAPSTAPPSTSVSLPEPPSRPAPARQPGSIEAPSPQASDLGTFRQAARKLAAAQNKHAYRELLKDWRTGAHAREKDQIIGEAIAEFPSDDLATAAGQLLLDGPSSEAQADALCAVLAAGGSAAAVEFLVTAVRKPQLREQALSHLATVSDPGAVSSLAALVKDADPEIVQAAVSALEGVGTDEARAVLDAHHARRSPRRP